jgi:hypothetical protein
MDGKGWGTGLTIKEILALEVAKTLNIDEYLFLMEQGDLPSLLGAARLFFSEELELPLPVARRGPFAALLCEAVLKGDQSRMSGDAIRHLKEYDCAETTELLRRLATGEISAASEGFPKDFPQARVAAALILAHRKVPGALEIITALAALPNLSEVDRESLNVSRVLLGEQVQLTKELFELNTYISYDALKALEGQGDKAALALIIEGAVNHDWALVREEAIFTVERMTGEKWYVPEHEMPEEVRAMEDFQRSQHYGRQVAEWWKEHRETFEFPGNAAPKPVDQKEKAR